MKTTREYSGTWRFRAARINFPFRPSVLLGQARSLYSAEFGPVGTDPEWGRREKQKNSVALEPGLGWSGTDGEILSGVRGQANWVQVFV